MLEQYAFFVLLAGLVVGAVGYCWLASATFKVSKAADLFTQTAAKAVGGLLNATLIDDLWNAITQRIDALRPSERAESKAEDT